MERWTMRANCAQCGTHTDCEPFSGLCVDCLIQMAKSRPPDRPASRLVDYKVAQSGERE